MIDYDQARIIAIWILKSHYNSFQIADDRLRIALAVSAYNIGRSAVRADGIIRWIYCADIVPDELQWTEKIYGIRKGTKNLRIKREIFK